MSQHKKDEKKFIYTFEDLEDARTHDPYWNAAQLELVYQHKVWFIYGELEIFLYPFVVYCKYISNLHKVLTASNDGCDSLIQLKARPFMSHLDWQSLLVNFLAQSSFLLSTTI